MESNNQFPPDADANAYAKMLLDQWRDEQLRGPNGTYIDAIMQNVRGRLPGYEGMAEMKL